MVLTSTTAPGKTFDSRGEIADHYKSDWHKYNLKRREAGLALLEEKEFVARLEAALALRKEKEKKNGTDHIKNITKKNYKEKKIADKKNNENRETAVPSSDYTKMEEDPSTEDDKNRLSRLPAALVESQENPEIDPKQSLFDQHRSHTLMENIEYMQKEYGFFLPDQDCLVDVEGLLGYCHEKIKLGHYCLYCEKLFPTWQGCQQHMINKEHCKVRYEEGFWDELDPFYDFRKDNYKFNGNEEEDDLSETSGMEVDTNDDVSEDGREDMSVDDEEEIYEGYQREIARFGLDVTALGELVFPDGRVVGHRALRRYYKQKLRHTKTNKPSVVAAQKASTERMYEGRVVNINQHKLKHDEVNGAGRGILVAVGAAGGGEFSTLSLYRYRAAVRKERRGDQKHRRLNERCLGKNTNKMDKKANRLMNNVSVAWAKR